MLDKERIKLMTKLKIFEQHEAQVFRVNSYMKSDYVTLHVIYTIIASSLAFFMLAGVYAISKYNDILESIQNTSLFKPIAIFLFAWLFTELVFGGFAFCFYNYRYRKSSAKVSGYVEALRQLDRLYEGLDNTKQDN